METKISSTENKENCVYLTEDQKNIAIDSELIHTPDGINWFFFEEDLLMIKSIQKAHQ